MDVRAEFIVYPFRPGEDPPPYVRAAIRAVEAADLYVEVGLLGQVVTGAMADVFEALRSAELAAFNAGATRFAVNLELVE